MENPYASPVSSTEPNRKGPRLRPLAIFVGWITDIGFSLVTGTVLGIIVAIQLAQQGIPLEQMQDEMNNTTWFLAVSVLLGTCGTLVGGYVAAWMGKDWPLRHGFAVAAVSMLTGLVPFVFMPRMQPLWVTVSAWILAVPAGLLGGYLRGTVAAKKAALNQPVDVEP